MVDYSFKGFGASVCVEKRDIERGPYDIKALVVLSTFLLI
jgi:hypothetical protein